MESRAAAAVLICIIGHACAVPIQEVVSAANVTSSGNHDNCNPGNTDLTTPTGNVQYFGWWAGSDGHGMGLAYSNLYADMATFPGTFLHPTSPIWKQCGNGKLKCMPRLDDYWTNFKLAPDYKERWAKAAPTWVEYQHQGKLLGFLIGDELQRRGASRQSIIDMAAEVRKTFPKGTAILWISDTMSPPLPPDIDWWSSDVYRTNPNLIKMRDCSFVEQQMKPLWNTMPVTGDQKWVVVPPAFLDPSYLGGGCTEDDYFRGVRNDFACVTRWANSDARVAAVIPFMFSNAPPLKGMASYWNNYPGVAGTAWAVMAEYAQKIQAKGFPPMPPAPPAPNVSTTY